ncbi:MAG: sensor histidine kinase [Gemmatimonadaceae bacterium]|nr:sensor histidine kinase [Gemmatimonadaceae bacterium]
MSMTVALGARRRARGSLIARIVRAILGVPLVGKLIGANVIIVAAAIIVQTIAFDGRDNAEMVAVLTALAAASVVNLILVRVALSPVADLQQLADHVSAGEFEARNTPSLFADAGLKRLGSTINELLDSLAAERKRIQDLGAEVVYAQDAERARISRELHDSIAQTLAAARFQLSAASTEASGDMKNRLAAANGLIGSALEEVKNVSYSLHPRVAEDLGLEAALGALARQVSDRSGIKVHVKASVTGAPIPGNVSATLFRVAQEALRNIEMHSHAKYATVEVVAWDGSIRIEVADDGRGFDAAAVTASTRGSGLASIRDRITLAGGSMQIDSVPNGGTRVIAKLQTKKAAS